MSQTQREHKNISLCTCTEHPTRSPFHSKWKTFMFLCIRSI